MAKLNFNSNLNYSKHGRFGAQDTFLNLTMKHNNEQKLCCLTFFDE